MRFLPPADILDKIAGVEESLKDNRKAGRLGIGGLLLAVAQLAIASATGDQLGETQRLVVGLGVFVLAGSSAIVAKTRLWLRESSQPFNYMCSLVEFKALGEVAGTEFSEIPVWIKYDVAEMLNERIGRLSFVDDARPEAEPTSGSASEHIKIGGEFLVRRKADGSWVLEVTPRVQVGGADAAATLGHPVHFVCPEVEAPPADGGDLLHTSAEGASAMSDGRSASGRTRLEGGPARSSRPTLSESDYEKLVERVYFSVATQIYRQIQKDVKRKIGLLPTRFLRATAYFHEAHDHQRSNTLDALDAARDLYQSAMELYDPRLRPLPERKRRRPYLLYLRRKAAVMQCVRVWGARLWPRLARSEVMAARAEIGYAETLLYRRTLAGLSGHRMNSVYEARPVAKRAIKRLRRVPIEVPGCRGVRFDAQVIYALACYQLELTGEAKRALSVARSLMPNRFDDDARYLYVAGVLEPRARFAIRLLRQAVERQPRFEMAQFELAQRMEMMWRTRPTLERSVAEMIQLEYLAVLKLNPGNLRAWGNLAYVRWLLGDLEEAEVAYERGREYKQIKRDATVASLDYGLARVAAEQGRCEDAYRHYLSASSAQVIQGVSDSRWTSAQYYFFDFIGPAIISRYILYFVRATAKCGVPDGPSTGDESDRFRQIVRSFVHNDFGEACHTYHIRNCATGALTEARQQYEVATALNPDAMLPHYNLHLLSKYEGDSKGAIEALGRLERLEPLWTDAILAWEATRTEVACAAVPAAGAEVRNGHEAPTAEQEKEEVARKKRLRLLLPHEWLWRTEQGKELFNWRAAYRTDHAQVMRWERELDDLHVRAIFLLVLNELHDKRHEGETEAPPSIKARHPVRWAGGSLEPEARAFLSRIREHFWPGNFDVLLESYRLDPKTTGDKVRDDMCETMTWWLDTDPTAYWALDQLFNDFKDHSGTPLKLFDAQDRARFLDIAREQLPDDTELKTWIDEKARSLAVSSTG